MGNAKSPLRVMRFDQLRFEPRFAYGEMAQLVEVCGASDGTELCAGWARFTDARIPWTITYDEVLTVIEGEFRLHANGSVHELGPRDSIWLPAGTDLVYESASSLVYFSVHPANW